MESASQAIAPFVHPGNLVILECTVLPSTTESVVAWILEERDDLAAPGKEENSFFAPHCPEGVLPGRILVELVGNDRVVGGIDDESTRVAQRFYQSFVRGESVARTSRTAELAKPSENAFRDVNSAFANELSMIADKLKVDVWELIALANRHPRVNILQPGPGVGDHRIAVDPWFIVDAAPEEAKFIRAARETNLAKTDWVLDQSRALLAQAGDNARIICLGLAYKPDVDDLRESAALKGAIRLTKEFSGRVSAIEPHVLDLPAEAQDAGVELEDLGIGDFQGDIVLALVGHRAFRDRSVFDSAVICRDFCDIWVG